MLEYGVESCYNKTLQRINRCHTWEQSVEAVQLTAAYGIHRYSHDHGASGRITGRNA